MSTITAGNVTVSCSLSADTTGNLVFQSGGNVTAMTIDTSQNVGIGTSSPATKFHVATGNDGYVTYTAGTLDYKTLMYSTGSVVYTGTWSNHPLAFNTNATERARIDTSGNLLVGTTSSGGVGFTVAADGAGRILTSNVSVVPFDVYLFKNNGTTVGKITINTSSTSYTTTSDYRLKEDVQPMTGALARVAALKPVTYKWKIDGADGEGFIAHELQAVVPDAVTGEKDAVNEDGSIKPQGIDTSFLVATLTAAIQEQQQMIETLQAEVAALKGASA